MSPTPPAVVLDSNGEETVPVFEWTLPLRVDNEPGRIVGVLSWIPSTNAMPWFTIVVLAFLAFGLAAFRFRSSAPAILLLGLAAAATMAGVAATASQVSEGRTFGVDLIGPIVVLAVAVFALVEGRRSDRSAARIVHIGSIGLTIWAVLRIDVLTHPILPTVLPDGVDRMVTAVVLGGAIGLISGLSTRIVIENRNLRTGSDQR
jgi:hypothetical protein